MENERIWNVVASMKIDVFFFFFVKRIGNPNGRELIEKLETKALIELVLNGDAIILRWRVPRQRT